MDQMAAARWSQALLLTGPPGSLVRFRSCAKTRAHGQEMPGDVETKLFDVPSIDCFMKFTQESVVTHDEARKQASARGGINLPSKSVKVSQATAKSIHDVHEIPQPVG